MAINLPVDFTSQVGGGGGGSGTGYPYQIKASDLQKNFVYAALDADESLIEGTGAAGGAGRKLKIPALTTGGGESAVLTCIGASMEWRASIPKPPSGSCILVSEGGTFSWVALPSGKAILASDGGTLSFLETEECAE
jgi:hypothetical protein